MLIHYTKIVACIDYDEIETDMIETSDGTTDRVLTNQDISGTSHQHLGSGWQLYMLLIANWYVIECRGSPARSQRSTSRPRNEFSIILLVWICTNAHKS